MKNVYFKIQYDEISSTEWHMSLIHSKFIKEMYVFCVIILIVGLTLKTQSLT